MKSFAPEVQAALAADTLVVRDFLWIEPRDRDTGQRAGWGAWSGAGDVTAQVLDPFAGLVSRSFEGAGSMVSISPFGMIAGLEVQTIDIVLAGVDSAVEQLVRGFDARLAPVRIYRGYFDPATQAMVSPAGAEFIGFVDSIDITTPEAGGDSVINLTCANHVQELTRKGTGTRSDADQKMRDPADEFYQHAATVGTWEVKWQPKG